jgi:signal transduction histidine kinase
MADKPNDRAGPADAGVPIGQRLRSAMSLLEATLEATADALLVVNLAGHVVRHNAHFATLWRIPKELLDTGDDERLLAFVQDQTVDPEAFRAGVRLLYADPERDSYDEIRCKDGRILERYSRPQRIEGKAVGRVWSFRDVTARRKAEAARDRLLESERAASASAKVAAERAAFLAEASRLLASLDHTSALESLARLAVERFADGCAVDLLDGNGTVRRVALAPPAAPAIAPPCEALGKGICVEQDDRRAVLGVPLAIAGRVIGAVRFTRERSRGFAAADLALAEDLASRVALSGQIARLYTQAQRALRLREEFLSVASHELRAPLASLQAAADGLLSGAYTGGAIPPGSPLGRPLRAIDRQVRRLSHRVNDLFEGIAVATSGVEIRPAEVDLSAVASAVVARFREDLRPGASEIGLTTPGPVVGRWDRERVEQVIAALLSNALRYGEGKPIEVAIAQRGDRALLTVRDRGAGIDPERLPDLFACFDRAGVPRDHGGLGLGLYIANAVVTAHGGSIRVESAPGEGSTFVVDLPLGGPPETP